MGPPNQHGGEKNAVGGWGWVGGPGVCGSGSCPLAGQTPAGPGGDIAGKMAPKKPR